MSRAVDLEFDGVLLWETPFGDLAATPHPTGCYFRFQGKQTNAADLHELLEVLSAALALTPLVPASAGGSDPR